MPQTQGKFAVDMRVATSEGISGRYKKEKELLFVLCIEPRSNGSFACSPFDIPTDLS
jgi:hypothetical protein